MSSGGGMTINDLNSSSSGISDSLLDLDRNAADNYHDARNNFIRRWENDILWLNLAKGASAYDDDKKRWLNRIHNGGGDGNPTIGYGYNLAAGTYNEIIPKLEMACGSL